MFDAGSATGKLGLDISEYTHGMLEAEAISSVFPQVVSEFLAEPLLGLIEVAKKAAEFIGESFTEIKNHALEAGRAAAMTGVSVEFLSSIAPIAGGVENLSMALKFLQNTAFDSVHGNKELAKTFASLGIDVTDGLGGMKGGEELLLELADAMKDIPSQGERISVAMQLMSRSGAEMLPFLMKGSEGIRALGEEQKRLGAVVDDQEVKTAKKLARLGQLWDAAWMGIKKTITEPIFEAMGENVDEAKAKIFAFSESVRSAIGSAFQFIGPKIKEIIPILRHLAETVRRELGPTFEALKPLFRSSFELFKNFATVIADNVTPALRLMAPILTDIARAMTVIYETTGKVVAKLNEWITLARAAKDLTEIVGNLPKGGLTGSGPGATTQPTGRPTTMPSAAPTQIHQVNVQRIQINGWKDLALEIAKELVHFLPENKRNEVDWIEGL